MWLIFLFLAKCFGFPILAFLLELQINVFVLGGVYVQLIQLLRLQDEPAFSRHAPASYSLTSHEHSGVLGNVSSCRRKYPDDHLK